MGGSLIARLRNFSLGYLVAMDAIGSSLWGGFGSPGLVNHFALIRSVVRCDGAMERWSDLRYGSHILILLPGWGIIDPKKTAARPVDYGCDLLASG